ncbi:LutC/YkgG family protein [Mucilaginibacter pocheonensis]|uniref:L-lactate dehydrogenase complex protein LldG n=1 Tax=Mucilaginibacter pocheonensis TaxID=398050 RepID=A0ABU1T6G8_9SPHI|nr:LUD domain-containing protein [Mucilaginibacter pocheonensis]MDR6940989.1 L-lactate dehydrogenase complex protein LldG [Mucilaginibacter pocheonensis]
MSREKILAAVKNNQPNHTPLPDLEILSALTDVNADLVKQYATIASAGGSFVYEVVDFEAIKAILQKEFKQGVKTISGIKELEEYTYADSVKDELYHSFADVELTILRSYLGVAENGALWLTETDMNVRVLPFISQHLAVVIGRDELVPTMAQAYATIGDAAYGYGAFISGPSKTADIEQSLVIGAHGPRSLSVFILE